MGPKPWLWTILDQKRKFVFHTVWLFLNDGINRRLRRRLPRADYIFLNYLAESDGSVLAEMMSWN